MTPQPAPQPPLLLLLPPAYANPGQRCVDDGGVLSSYPQPGSIRFLTPNGTYGVGSQIDIEVVLNYGRFGGHVAHTFLQLETGDTDRLAVYKSHAGGKVVYNYTVQQGDYSEDLNYRGTDSLFWSFGNRWQDNLRSSDLDEMRCVLWDPSASQSLASQSDIVIDTIAPRVNNVTSPDPDGTYNTGDAIVIAVNFTEPVVVHPDRAPTLSIGLGGGAGRAAYYASGDGTRSLNFTYAVRNGDASPDLDYNSSGALAGGGIRDAAGNAANLTLPDPGARGSLSSSSSIAVNGIDTGVTRVFSPNATGAYSAGAIHVLARFSDPVTVDRTSGSPLLALDTGQAGRNATYASGSGTRDLLFVYAVAEGDVSPDLNYPNASALLASGSAVTNATGHAAALSLPHPSSPDSLAGTSGIAVDTVEPAVLGVSSPDGAAAYGIGGEIRMQVRFSEAVSVGSPMPGAPPSLALDTGQAGRNATYVSGSGTRELLFSYAAQAGDRSDDLDYAGRDALSGSIADIAGNPANLTLPAPGSPGSLARSSDVLVDPAVPQMIAAGSARDGLGGFEALYGPRSVATFSLGGRVHALVSGSADDAVQLIRVHDNGTMEAAAEARDGPEYPRLIDPWGIDTFALNGSTYALVAAHWEYAVQLIRVHEDGALSPAGSLVDDVTIDLAEPARVSAFKMGGNTYALVTSFGNHAVQLIRVHNNTGLEARGTESLNDQDGDLALWYAFDVDVFGLGNRTYALVGGYSDAGVQLVRVHESGALEASGSLDDGDGAELRLSGPREIAAFPLGNRTYALVASEFENAVQLIRVHDNGTLEAAGSASDGAAGFDGLGQASGVDVFRTGDGATYAAVASRSDDAVQLIRVRDGDGALLAAGSAAGGGGSPAGFGRLDGPRSISAFAVAGRTYALAASFDGDAVQLIELSPASVARVGSEAGGGPHKRGAEIRIDVSFDGEVRVEGTPVLELNSGGSAEYVGGNNTDTLEFRYQVRDGEQAYGLDYAGIHALSGGSGNGTIVHAASGVQAGRALPAAGTGRSLGDLTDIAVDSRPPSVVSVAAARDGAYREGRQVSVAVEFDERVAYSGADPVLVLNVGGEPRPAAYKDGNGTESLVFAYTVRYGDRAAGLDYYSTASLTGNITDMAGHAAGLALPAPGSPGSLSMSSHVLIDYAAPPLIAAASAAGGGGNGGGWPDGISGASDIDVAVVGSRTYAVVPSPSDDAVQLIRVHENGTALSQAGPPAVDDGRGGAFPRLDGARGVDAFSLGGRAYAAVAPDNDTGVQLIRVHENGTLSPAGSAAHGGPFGASASHDVGALEAGGGGSAHVVASLFQSSAVQLFRAGVDGALAANGSVRDGDAGFERLENPRHVDAFEMGGAAHAIVTSTHGDAGVHLIRIHENGTMEAGGSAAAGGDFPMLHGPRGVDAFEMGNATYALVASHAGSGVQLIRVHENGTLSPAGSAADGAGGFDRLGGAHAVDTFSLGGRTYAVAASPSDSGVQLIRVHENGTLSPAGSAADGAGGFDRLGGAHAVDTFSLGGRTYAAVASPVDGVQLIRLSAASVTGVASADGAYGPGAPVRIAVTFDGRVDVAGQHELLLNSGGTAAYESGNGSETLTFLYRVGAGENAGDLGYLGADALSGTGTITEAGTGIAVDRTLPRPGTAGSLSGSSNVTVDTVAPRVVGVALAGAAYGGAYGIGDAINIAVRFTEAVTVSGAPTLALEMGTTGRSATYASGSGTASLVFTYTVADGDESARMDYAGTSALSASGGAVVDGAGNDADLALPAPGGQGSLSGSGAVAVDGIAPRVVGVAPAAAGAGTGEAADGGAYGIGDAINIAVRFTEAVTVSGAPTLALETGTTGRSATYASGSGTASLVFTYTVADGDESARLEYAGTSALSASGGAVVDGAGNDADLALPAPGGQGSLSGSGAVAVDGIAPRVVGVALAAGADGGAYGIGDTVDIAVRFTEAVTVSGAPTLALETGTTGRNATYASGSGTASLVFTYTVADGDESARLEYAGTSALSASGGAVVDGAGNDADLALPAPGGQGSLSGSGAVAVDGIAPRVVGVALAAGADGGAYGIGDAINIAVRFTEAVTVSGAPTLALETGATDRNATYASGSGTASLVFTYTVADGDESARLEYAGTSALSASGGAVVDGAGNDADLALPAPGGQGSLGNSSSISVRGGAGGGGGGGTTNRTAGPAAATPLEIAVAGAAAGSTVRVQAGTYAADVLAVDKPLTIEAADPENPPVFTNRSRIVVSVSPQPDGGGPVVIRGLVFESSTRAPDGGAPAPIAVESAQGAPSGAMPVTIEGNTFRNTCGTAVRAAAAAAGPGAHPIAGLTIRDNRFYDIGGGSASCGAAQPAGAIVAGRHDGAAPAASAPAAPQLTGMTVRDNHIFGTSHTGISIAGADGLAVMGNHIEGVPDDGIRIIASRSVQVHLNTIVGANQAPRAGGAGAGGAAIEVWSGSDDVDVTLNRVSGSAGALLVCAGECDPGPNAANGTGGTARVAAVPVNAAGGASDIRFSHNVLARSNTGVLVANAAGGELDARANYYPGYAASAAGRASPAGAVLLEPALDYAGPVRVGAVVADGPSSTIRSVDAAVRAAFELGVLDFNAAQARDGGAVGLEPAVRAVDSPDYTAAARAAHASAVSALRSGSSADARMLPVLHNSISSAMALYDASGAAGLAAISAMGASHAHYPFVLDRGNGAIVAHGADASLVGGYDNDGAGPSAAAAAAGGLLDFSPPAVAAAGGTGGTGGIGGTGGTGGTGVDPGHPGAPWKWRAHESVNPATNASEPKRSVLALHPGPDGAAHTEDDLVFGAGYHPGPGAAHLVVAAGDAAAAAAETGAIVAISPASTASQLAARDALFRLAPPDARLAGVVVAQALADRQGAAAAQPVTIVALNDSASLQSTSLAGELYEIDLQGALPDGADRVAVVSYNSSSPTPPAGGGSGGAGWAPAAADLIRAAASESRGDAAVVYSGRAGAFAALAEALGGQPPPNTRWYSTGELARAELAASGPDAASLARAGQLAAVLQRAVPNAAIDAALAAPGAGIVLDESTRGPAYAAYDAPALLGRAMASTPGVPGAPAAVARAIDEDVARTHAGALGSPLILDRNGDLVLPIAYTVSAFPAGGDPGGAWGQTDGRIGERSCGIALAKGALDFGILSLGRYSRPDTQTVINTGTLPYRSVTLDPGDWTYASGQTLPASITELRELGRAAAYAGAASGFVVAPGLAPGQDSNVQFRINLTAYQSLPPGEASQTINYLVECRAAAAAGAGGG